MTTLAKPDDCVTSDGACFFLSTTKVFVTSPEIHIVSVQRKSFIDLPNLNSSQVTWVEAEQACMAYGGHLASLADEDENIFFGLVE